MTENPRLNTALHFLDRINAGAQAAWDLLHADAMVIVIGTTALSGVYAGRKQIEHVLLANWFERVRSVRFDLLEHFASDDAVALLVRPSGQTVDGRSINPVETVMGVVLDFRDDRIAAMRLHPDTSTIETELYGNRLVVRERSRELLA